jgi:hypothetical protein
MSDRRQPIGQDRESFLAWSANPATHADLFVPIIVSLTESPSVADDRVVSANRTLPRQTFQWNYPGSMLSFGSSSAIKRITAGAKARR